ncbi:Beta carbonic anhydrase 1 [Trichinella spiralis]|uniref:Carbonic anhydrase n=1 Tax=Trichinella spiralis TaxID=6334 RepID=A0A0V1C328_TRISP|nr:Beta carbonic anhydrase 1 [Trichinella spiralis]
MRKLLNGVVKYRETARSQVLKRLRQAKEDFHPVTILFSCVDARLITSRVMQLDIGDAYMFGKKLALVADQAIVVAFESCTCFACQIIHLAHTKLQQNAAGLSALASIELACLMKNVKDIVVCGHSDCSAMNLLHSMEQRDAEWKPDEPLKSWLQIHGSPSVQKYNCLIKGQQVLQFIPEYPFLQFSAKIDPSGKLTNADKLSQIHCLQQLENIASHHFLQKRLLEGLAKLHAVWFDLNTANLLYQGDSITLHVYGLTESVPYWR